MEERAVFADGASRLSLYSFDPSTSRLALVDGRDYVLPDDIKSLAVPVLAHRIVDQTALDRGDASRGEALIREILDAVPVPV